MILESKASQIVTEINKILPQKISIIDSDGVILASSDSERIGTVHEGALKLIEEGLSELIIRSEYDYSGGREGIVYPISVRGELMGALAIGGEPKEVSGYAQVVQRMTEILLLEEIQNRENEQTQLLLTRYISEWLHGEQIGAMEDFIVRGRALGIDITVPRRIVILDVVFSEDATLQEDFKRTGEAVKKLQAVFEKLYGRQAFYIPEKTYFILGIPAADDETIRTQIHYAVSRFCEKDKVCLRIGVDGGLKHYRDINQSYNEARRAWMATRWERSQAVRFYNDIDMEIFIDEISDSTKQEFIHKIFPEYDEGDLKEAVELLREYYRDEGSITRASEKLFVHKNTLQKKLLKIAERTGKDPRSHKYAYLFINAIYFYDYLNR